ncbi:hypothetical protein CH75_06325 [Dyella jiangningensis]|nr:hypothetical protein CH75_06325 [Dyella jiangningensis]
MNDGDPSRILLMQAAELMAHKKLLAALIATHQEPEVLRAIWSQSKAQWIEEQESNPLFQLADYKQAFLDSLSWMSQAIDRSSEPR